MDKGRAVTKFITCVSGKGGVGKTTSSLNLAAALNFFGKDCIVVDANLTTPNIGLHLGVPIVPVNLHHVLKGKKHVAEAIYLHPSGIKIVPAGLSLDDLRNLNVENLKKKLSGLRGLTDFVIIDAAAGLGREALAAMHAGDELIVVTNPELPAVTDALKTIKLAEELKIPVRGIVVTRTKDGRQDMNIRNIEILTDTPVISVIPEDENVRKALVSKDIVVNHAPKSYAAVSYKQLAASVLGREYNEAAEPIEIRKGIFSKLLEKFGFT